MGTGFQHFGFVGDPSSNVFEHLSNVSHVGAGAGDCTSTILCLDSPGASTSFFSNTKEVKNQWSMMGGLKGPEAGGECSLVLGLGYPPSPSDSKGSGESVCTASSAAKEIEESSVGIDLEFSLHSGYKKSQSKTNSTCETRKAPGGGKKPMFDLNLSLSEPTESGISSAILSSGVDKTNLDMLLMVNGIPLGDVDSPSSHRDDSNCLLPSVTLDKTNAIFESTTPGKVAPDYSTMVTTVNSSVTCSSGLSQQQHRCTSYKMCRFQGCQKGARGASGLCIAHGGGRRCQKVGCHKGAEGRTVYCKAHGGGRRCQFLGCTKSAEGRTDLCIAHGGGRRCTHEGCSRAARGRSGLCIRHGGGKRCQIEDCPKSAEGLSGLCISHGGGRRCHFPECTKGAQGSTMFCKAHGGGKRCSVFGCTKGAEGSTPFCKAHGGGKRCTFEGGVCPKSVHGGTLFCVAHGGGKRCAVPECTKSARGKTDFCVRHGGGKRCHFQGCDKSAQGSTDFCKAHGGGKRCLWGQPGTEFAIPDASQCDKFARGKTGLCSSHSALVQDKCVHGGGTLLPTFFDPKPTGSGKITVEDMNVDVLKMQIAGSHTSFNPIGFGNPSSCLPSTSQVQFPVGGSLTLPEGRVHGGALMAMALFGGTSSIPSSEAGTSSYVAPPYNRM